MDACDSDLIVWAKDVTARLTKEAEMRRHAAKSKAKR
jgi:hypothetical protein